MDVGQERSESEINIEMESAEEAARVCYENIETFNGRQKYLFLSSLNNHINEAYHEKMNKIKNDAELIQADHEAFQNGK